MTETITTSVRDTALKISTDNSSSIIVKTIERIKEDFGKHGYSIKYTGHPEEAYEQIVSELRIIVEDIIKEGYTKLVDILCGIDLSEKKVKDSISTNPHVSPSKIISRLIIEREFKKVCNSASYGSE